MGSFLKTLQKSRIKYYIVILIFVFLIVSFSFVKSTFAWMVSADIKNNQIGIMQYIFSHQIQEEFATPDEGTPIRGGNIITKRNWVQNEGDIASFVRVKVFPVLTTMDSSVHLEVQFDKQLYYENLNTSEWKNGGDGYFYYTKLLEPGASTEILFEKVRLDENIADYANSILTVTLIAESVETRKWHYREAWWGSDAEINIGDLGDIDLILRGLAQ